MDDLSWLILLVGVIVILIVLMDVFLTVLHVDTDGPVASRIIKINWKFMMFLVRIFPSSRRIIISLAGPFMMTSIFVFWILTYTLGFSLIYWPYMDLFRTGSEITSLGYIEALYFSGNTATVLGFGDISPLNNIMRIISIIQAGVGFALLTAIVTYLINVVSGVTDRNTLSLGLWAETGQTGDGIVAVVRSLAYEEGEDFQMRLQQQLQLIYKVHQKMHQYPILDLFYRSKEEIYSPEYMIKSATEMAIAAQIVSSDPKYKRLVPVSKEMGKAVIEMMNLIAREYLQGVQKQLQKPEPGKEDSQQLEKILNTFEESLPGLNLESARKHEQIRNLIFGLRVFLDELDDFTGWRMDFEEEFEHGPEA